MRVRKTEGEDGWTREDDPDCSLVKELYPHLTGKTSSINPEVATLA